LEIARSQAAWTARLVGLAIRRPTAMLRALPSVFILGATKSGSSSLASILWQHPAHVAPFTKEHLYLHRLPGFRQHWESAALISFLWGPYENGHSRYTLGGYKKFFPLMLQMRIRAGRVGASFTSECDPFNLYCPVALRRIRGFAADPRFVITLRNPIDRAYSDYCMHRSWGEERTFEECVDDELLGREGRFRKRFLNQSVYEPHLVRWLREYGKERLLVIHAEKFFRAPGDVAERMYEFLGLAPVRPSSLDLSPRNRGPGGDPLSPSLRARLRDYFRGPNHRLYELLGEDLGWDD
jgi:hypothetical protein